MNDLSGNSSPARGTGVVGQVIWFCLRNRLVVGLAVIFAIVWGVMVAPFNWNIEAIPRDPVPVDAIPDLGENQQIVFTEWLGRSPQDIEDQITYPLTVAMLGIPGVRTVRSYSMFGFSSIYVIFEERSDFYWSRSRVLEKLNSLPSGAIPDGIQPALGPDATGLGQVFWYTLEGLDEKGHPTGGWDLHELRSVQDWTVRYGLMSAGGISEVASVGGFVREYQIDVDPDAMRAHAVTLDAVYRAVQMSNLDVGARTIEVNRVEYVIRGLGFIKTLEDLENTVIRVADHVPIYIRDIAHVSLGPGGRRGALDKGGAEAVGGVAVVRYQENPLAAIKNLKKKIAEISPGLPEKVIVDYSVVNQEQLSTFAEAYGFPALKNGVLNQDAWLDWLRSTPQDERPPWLVLSKLAIVPFYDRMGLINETLGTLSSALTQQILVTVVVILVMMMHLRSSLVISLTLPLAVLVCFIAMKLFGVDANIVALSGIAIAVGTIVDMGIIVCENILRHLDAAEDRVGKREPSILIVFRAAHEVGGAVLTAILTTVVSFLPVFTMMGAEGKLFRPLAFTKTFVLLASVILALTVIPVLAHILFAHRETSGKIRAAGLISLLVAGIITGFMWIWWAGAAIAVVAAWHLSGNLLPRAVTTTVRACVSIVLAGAVTMVLAAHWLPLGPGTGYLPNLIAVGAPIAGLLLFFWLFGKFYAPLLRWFLNHKIIFLPIPVVLVIIGATIWLGAGAMFGWLPETVRDTRLYSNVWHSFPGLGKEFMPDLDEGSFLYMPTTMPHASIGEALDVLQKQDAAIAAIAEVESAVGKIGRAESALDPAPISMIETVINYKSEFITDSDGKRLRFQYDAEREDVYRDERGEPVRAPDGETYRVAGTFTYESGHLVSDDKGQPFRLWRPPLTPALNPGRQAWAGIRSPTDIWDEILDAADIPGTTSAPKLQPIAARIVMLQSGMRAPMGIKVKGPDQVAIETVVFQLEKLLKQIPSVEPATVIADRIVGKPYLEINVDRQALARYGVHVKQLQDVIEIAIGGRKITTTVEGRERYPVRVRYLRELRDTFESLEQILVPAASGEQIPLRQLTSFNYVRGPQVIKSEDTFLVGYVIFDKKPGRAEVNVVEECSQFLQSKLDSGELVLPAGVSYTFAGSYENQVRAAKTLSVVLPLALFVIFMILYLQFRSVPTTLMVFSAILVAWAGGFIMIWCYAQDWFLDAAILGTNLRTLFQVHTINLSVAIWVGFLALFGIASDDGVVIATYLNQSFETNKPGSISEIREATVSAAQRRIRPCLMTSATTILALLPVLTSVGRGSDIMVPMAIPSFGGMLVVLVSEFVVPVLYCSSRELQYHLGRASSSRSNALGSEASGNVTPPPNRVPASDE